MGDVAIFYIYIFFFYLFMKMNFCIGQMGGCGHMGDYMGGLVEVCGWMSELVDRWMQIK